MRLSNDGLEYFEDQFKKMKGFLIFYVHLNNHLDVKIFSVSVYIYSLLSLLAFIRRRPFVTLVFLALFTSVHFFKINKVDVLVGIRYSA